MLRFLAALRPRRASPHGRRAAAKWTGTLWAQLADPGVEDWERERHGIGESDGETEEVKQEQHRTTLAMLERMPVHPWAAAEQQQETGRREGGRFEKKEADGHET